MKRFLSYFKNRRRQDANIDRELEFHLQELTDEYLAAGMTAAEANRRARAEFGGKQHFTEELRDLYRVASFENLLSYLRWAFRSMRKAPAFSLTVIVTLAIGIGANSAVFSAIDAILLRPLPYPDADRLVRISQVHAKRGTPGFPVAPIRVEDWNSGNATFTSIAGYYSESVSEISGTLPEKVTLGWVGPRFLETFGVAPVIGRNFSTAELHAGGPPAILISDRFWRRRFGADPNVLGKTLRIGRNSWPVIGVMPPTFLAGDEMDLWGPVPSDSTLTQNRNSTWFTVVGRLKPGVPVEEAQANLMLVQGQLAQRFPQTDRDIAVRVQPLKDTKVGSVRKSLWILFGAVTLLLVISCTNIAALLLARMTEREREISIRCSLGASRRSIIAQLLTESLVLAVAGAALGLLAASAAAGVFRTLAHNLPRVAEIRLDWRIVLYTLASGVTATLLYGLLPAVRATRKVNLQGSLAQSGRSQVSAGGTLHWLLVGIQVMLAVTLLTGAGLVLRSLREIGRVQPGFDASGVLVFRISASWAETADMTRLTSRMDRTLEVLRAMPGIEAAATSDGVPGVGAGFPGELRITGQAVDPHRKIVVKARWVSEGYFATLRIPLLAGEACTPGLSGRSVVVNDVFAKLYLNGPDAIGHSLELVVNPFHVPPARITGVARETREEGLRNPPAPTAYWCYSAPVPDPYFFIRIRSHPAAFGEIVRRKIHELEPARSVYDVLPLRDRLYDSTAQDRLRAVLLTSFAAMAVTLACIGLYGTLNYLVSTRRREIGLRLALGAVPGQIAGAFLRRGVSAAAVGCLAGLALAAAASRLLATSLFGVSPLDPATYVAVAALMVAVAALASVIPSARAASVDPQTVLRDE